jgi:sirohydrochlorin cobaltochelatase
MYKKLMIRSMLSVLVIFTMMGTPAQAGEHGATAPKKVGILLVAFGSSEASAQISFDNLDQAVRQAYPEVPVRWAFTSHIIRAKLADQGKALDSPAMALARMQDEKFTHVAVQSVHTIAGEEYHELVRIIGGFKAMGAFEKIVMGDPLMTTQADMQLVVEAILENLPQARRRGEAVVFMGHGTHHPANAGYAALMYQLQLKDPNLFVGTVEGYPDVDLIREQMTDRKIKRAYLMPFMSVAGDHAKNDMAGSEEDSWASIFTGAGIQCVPILKGTAEYDGFVKIWVAHAGEALKALQ